MPTSLIPIIARTNTIDEWRIQTNKSATDLNDLGFYNYDKNQGTLILSNTSILNITANGTPLQVANNVLFQSSLTLGNTLFLGVQSSATGNIVAGGTISVRGPGQALSVSNNSYVGGDAQVVNNIYANNFTSNGSVTVANNLTVSTGVLRLNGTGNVAYINSGAFSSNTIYASDTNSSNVKTSNLFASFARIDVLDNLAFASIGILENVTGNSYYLSSNSHTSNSISTRYLTANISGNIVNFSSNTATINSATVLNGNVVTLVSNSASVNNLSVNNSTSLVGNIVTLSSNSSTINVASINTASINTLSSYNLTSTHRITANTVISNNLEVSTINASWVNVSSNLWLQSNSQLRIYAPNDEYESLIVDGKTTLRTALITNNLTVQGTWTAVGDIEYETNEIVLNKRTPTNSDAVIRNERSVGDDAIIQWSESNDQWLISKGNTYSQLYGILDSSLLDSSVLNVSSTNIATSLSVNTAHTVAQTSGRYANSSYIHANAAFNWANSVSSTLSANTSRLSVDISIAGSFANAAYNHANSSHQLANTVNVNSTLVGLYANAAFAAANAAAISGGVISGGYANSAFGVANNANQRAISAGSYSNSAFSTANTAATAAALAQSAADSAALYANAAFTAANNATDTWVRNASNSASSYANSAYTLANTAVVRVQANQTVTGNLNIVGRIESNDIKFSSGSALLQGSNFVLNANQNPNQSPSLSATIEVDRGVSPNAIFRYNETIDRWEYTHALSEPAAFSTLGFVSERANNVTGGGSNRIVYQTDASSTSFIDAPVTANYFLKWTGSAFTWSDVPSVDLSTANIDASRLTSGLLPTARVSKVNPSDGTRREYPMHINGDAAYATTAGSATTASSATTANNAQNVIAGGTVVTGTIGSDTLTSFTSYGKGSIYGNFWARSGGTTTSKSDPNNTAALKVSGDAAVSGDVYSTFFRGTATAALYADLAEKYLADDVYPTGTVMMVGGNKEITAATIDGTNVIIGVVSEKPSYIMNDGLENGTTVGLKGRLPVRVIGKCKKGDLLEMSDIPGIAKSSTENKLPVRLICLENKDTDDESLIEVAIM